MDANSAMEMVTALESKGFSCWVAPRDIPAGTYYPEIIHKAIKDSEAFVLILTEHSELSKQVLREIQLATEEGKHIFPIALDGIVPHGSMHYLLCVYQRISATLASMDKAASEVSAALKKLSLDREPPRQCHKVDLRLFLKDLTSSSLQQNIDRNVVSRVAIDVPVLQNILEGAENEKRDGKTRTLEGFADMISAVYLLSKDEGLKELLLKLESADYKSLSDSWAKYEKADITKFYKEFRLARSILAGAQYEIIEGNDRERSFQEGRGRALFMIDHIISS